MTRRPPPDHTDREPWIPPTRRLAAVTLAALLVASAGLAPAAAQSDGDTVALETDRVPSTGNATVAGTTALDPGTELRILLRSTGDTEPAFLRSTTATVGPDGAWNATVDLSPVETHDRMSVTVTAAEGDTSETFEASLRDDRASGSPDEAPISTPGFGVIVAVAAILASAALLARTRR
ncbi:BGTF surface domain-containing protein [Halobellus ruber]|uniref:PGF-CTERM sorting domain-containing protein n=1 Tax=Halobellus ruber TaxID=2761102 RepID=A0A7J9SHR9_9EURY|nr:BGTF surface domain-containing protein [Halobellus ruber]MBB6645679.1 PGF-CTERM sorting domain-containing protein [Halobellus ruber]